MKILKDRSDPDRFFSSLAGSADRVLMLDYDGTLAPFREERDEALPYTGVIPLIPRLMGLDRCRTIFITGRGARDLARLIDMDIIPEIWGCHGFERLLPSGEYSVQDIDENLLASLREAKGICSANLPPERCEQKPFSVAVHWRGADTGERNAIEDFVSSELSPFALDHGLLVHDFRGGTEIMLPGADKGSAVSSILDSYEGTFSAAYLGDDRTDEDAFRAISGRGLSVLVAKELRDTSADIWIRPPGELVEFLERWIASCGGRS